MSLILDALKKAQKDQETPNPSTPNWKPPRLNSDKPHKRRLLLLVILLATSLGVLAIRQFYKNPSLKRTPSPKPIAELKMPQEGTAMELRLRALDNFQNGNWEEALKGWERLALLTPTDPEVYNNLGLTLKKAGEKKGAYDAYRKALALQADYPEALNNLGVLLMLDAAKGEAKNYFEKALLLKADYAEPYFNLALILEADGNLSAARSNYKKFLELAPQVAPDLKTKIEEKVKTLK